MSNCIFTVDGNYKCNLYEHLEKEEKEGGLTKSKSEPEPEPEPETVPEGETGGYKGQKGATENVSEGETEGEEEGEDTEAVVMQNSTNERTVNGVVVPADYPYPLNTYPPRTELEIEQDEYDKCTMDCYKNKKKDKNEGKYSNCLKKC
jgi:hypothetical protein